MCGCNGFQAAGGGSGGGTLANPTAVPTWEHVGTFTFADWNVGADTGTVDSGVIQFSREMFHAIQIKPSQSFQGGALTAYTIAVESGATPITPGFDVLQDPGGRVYEMTDFNPPYIGDVDENKTVYIRASCEGGNLSDATQGSVDIWFLFSRMPAP